MVKNTKGQTTDDTVKLQHNKISFQKVVVLASMIIIGIFMIIYRLSSSFWADKFTMYNLILLAISALLLILVIASIAKNARWFRVHELTGFVMIIISAFIMLLAPARNFLGLTAIIGDGLIIIIIGLVLLGIATAVLMRTGGFVGSCFVGVLFNVFVSGYYFLMNTSAVGYNTNTILLMNLSIIFFIASFITLVYHDAKFFYLANLIKHGKKLRKEKKYQSALRYCDKSIRIYPNFATAWNNKGNILFNMGKKTDAVKCYKKALSLNPDYLPAKENLKLAQRQ